MIRRFVITHVNDKDGLRRLTFAKDGRDTYETREAADAALVAFRGPRGLPKVLSVAELATLLVLDVECYDHGDPVAYYHQPHGAGWPTETWPESEES